MHMVKDGYSLRSGFAGKMEMVGASRFSTQYWGMVDKQTARRWLESL